MWSNSQPNSYYQPSQSTQQPQQQQTNQKHDVFVGNLAFSTTEEQIHQAFSELGRIIKIRMVTDLETGKPRGFAFVEFENAQDALSAIRNMNEYELNGRKVRVNFSNSSHLETLASQLGMDMTQKTKSVPQIPSNAGAGGSGGMHSSTTTSSGGHSSSAEVGTHAVANALKAMSKGEMYDVIAKLKDIADNDPDEARKLISEHPQLPEAILFLMSQLDMMKTPLNNSVLGVAAVNTALPPPIMMPPPPPPVVDPRVAGASIPPPPVPSDPRDPRSRAIDPRSQVTDPRKQASDQRNPPPLAPPPAQHYMPGGMTQQPPPPPPMGVAGLDPALVQQVMGLTQAQIAQLPPDKQSSILALRQQIQNSMGGAR